MGGGTWHFIASAKPAKPKPHLIRKKKISVNTATHNFLLICKKKHNVTLKSIKSLLAKTFTRNLSSL